MFYILNEYVKIYKTNNWKITKTTLNITKIKNIYLLLIYYIKKISNIIDKFKMGELKLKKIAIIGTLDSKGEEYSYLKNIIERQGLETLVIDVGIFDPSIEADIKNEDIAKSVNESIKMLQEKKDRGYAVEIMSKGAVKVVKELYDKGEISGIISLGGSGGTALATPCMRTLPIGVPKIMVSTLASGDTRPYVGVSDLIMMHSVVDISGLNSISKKIIRNAANAIVGMVNNEEVEDDKSEEKKLIAATMFGVTTPCVTKAREYLESKGYEVIVFHATGTGGQAMENLIDGGFIDGVLDITTTELCDELVGGVLSAGPNRLEASVKRGIPQIVSTGALDMVNFGPYETVPEKFKDRKFYKHNPTVTLMRTTKEECRELGKLICEKLNKTNSKTAIVLPLKGISMIDVEGQPFYGQEEDQVLFDTIKNNIDNKNIEIIEVQQDINDERIAILMAKKLIKLMENK